MRRYRRPLLQGQERASDGLTRAARVLAIALLVELAILTASGVALFFLYRPTAAQSWDDLATLRRSVTFASLLRDAHRFVAHLTLWTALATGVLIAIEPSNRSRWIRSVVLGVVLIQVVLLASFTGYLLPWDQLALWAVTIGTNMRGYTVLFDDRVRFVLLDGKEIGKSTLLRWTLVHGLLLGPVAIALVTIALRRLRSTLDE
jgi:quinol-cytochrome oxidoreductase complex cytochrome b subunit